MKCLVIDDSDVTLFVTQNILESIDVDVVVAKTIDDAYEQMKDNKLDVIITDIHLEKENAAGFISTLKMQAFDSPPIIALTGVDDDEQKKQIIELGADDYLLKPTTLEKIRVSFDKLGLM